MNKISSESTNSVCLSRVSILLLPAALLSIASAGCIEPPAPDQAPDQATNGATNGAADGTANGSANGTADESANEPASEAALESMVTASAPPGMQPLRILDEIPVGPAPRTAAANAAASGFQCSIVYAIAARGSNRWVSAEFGYGGDKNGELRARALSVHEWEKFRFCGAVGSNVVAIDAFGSNRWVSAELAYGAGNNAMLRARATQLGPWEVFSLWNDGFGGVQIRSEGNGLLVSAEFGYGGGDNAMLRARNPPNVVGPWERFDLVPL